MPAPSPLPGRPASAAQPARQGGRRWLRAASLPLLALGVGIVLGANPFHPNSENPDAVARAVRDFLTTPVDWYMHLALHTHRHQRVPLSRIYVPAVFVAGSWDILAGAKDMRSAAERMKEADYHEFRASHFVQMEHAEAVHALLLDFVERVG